MDTLPGRSYPIGASVLPDGVNFCVFSKNCFYVELLLFDAPDAEKPSRVIRLDPARNRTFYYWHVLVPGLKHGQLYGYRVHGPFDPASGLRFDGSKVLLDPYARAIARGNYNRKGARDPGDNAHCCMKSVVIDSSRYDWEGDMPIRSSETDAFIYELHVGGFTSSPDSALPHKLRGTFAGMKEKIPHLLQLGVTEVELLPVQQFDAEDAPNGLVNYWGYSPIGFFAPHSGYAADQSPGAVVDEFKDLVKALHKAGIEVILDVVFNHTAEGDHTGPTLCFRGFENRAYYIPDPANRAHYANYSGCGNTFNANQSIARRMIVDCLRYWVSEMHVDGFRFDLASSLSRDEWGNPLQSPPILWEIESDPILSGTRIIAEAWDAAGLYQVGSFIGHRWAEWNGVFRDDVRRFVRGDSGQVRRMAHRISGSPDLFGEDWEPHRSINFVSCHDGFTIADLVSYNHKHNDANREQNRDGMSENFSWNCGIEGETTDQTILSLRRRQIKNFLVIMFISQGTPMIQMGDEAGRTQKGNNNAYCQNNEISWFSWSDVDHNADLVNLVRSLAEFRVAHPVFRLPRSWDSRAAMQRAVFWSGVNLWQPDFSDSSRSLAFMLNEPGTETQIFVILNAYHERLTFELPSLETGHWKLFLDTSLPAVQEITAIGTYTIEARSSAILVSSGKTQGMSQRPEVSRAPV